MSAAGQIKLMLPSSGEVTLTPNDHVATGGEGAVYVKNGTAFKIYLDPLRARANGIEDKVRLLAQLKHPYIVAPREVAYDKKHAFVGYAMPFATGEPLVKAFTNAWRDKTGFTSASAVALVENMRLAVTAAHDLGALLVDGNEMNYLVEGCSPRLIDVDSWQIDRFPGTALMPSIKDYHSAAFSPVSDWFAWGIVSFQVFTGIHPYKGTHPEFKKGDLAARMLANASVFDPKVKLNAAVRDFSLIPPALRDWYAAVFQQGTRAAPPSAKATPVPASLTRKLRRVGGSSGVIRHERLLGLPGVIRHVSAGGVAFYEGSDGLHAYDLQRRQEILALSSDQIQALFRNESALVRFSSRFVYLTSYMGAVQGRWVAAEKDTVPTSAIAGSLPLAADRFVVIGNRVFVLSASNEAGMIELALMQLGDRTLLSVKTAWPVATRSTRFFDGVALMDRLGTPFIVVPEKEDALHIYRVEALAGYRVIQMLARGPGYVQVTGISRSDGQTYRLRLKLEGEHYTVAQANVVDDPALNLAVTERGIAVGVFEDGVLTVEAVSGTASKQVPDAAIDSSLRLFALPTGVHYSTGQDIFNLSLGAT